MKREDMHKYRVDFSDVEYFIQIHEALMRDLDFPDYYGGNLDALWDCLTDMLGDWADIELVGFEGVAKKFPTNGMGFSGFLPVQNTHTATDIPTDFL